MALFIVFESKTASFVPVVSKSSSSSRSCKPDGAVYRSLFISIDIYVFFFLNQMMCRFLFYKCGYRGKYLVEPILHSNSDVIWSVSLCCVERLHIHLSITKNYFQSTSLKSWCY